MIFNETYLYAAIGVATLFIWLASTAISLHALHIKGKPAGLSLAIGIFFGPIAAVVLLLSRSKEKAVSLPIAWVGYMWKKKLD